MALHYRLGLKLGAKKPKEISNYTRKGASRLLKSGMTSPAEIAALIRGPRATFIRGRTDLSIPTRRRGIAILDALRLTLDGTPLPITVA